MVRRVVLAFFICWIPPAGYNLDAASVVNIVQSSHASLRAAKAGSDLNHVCLCHTGPIAGEGDFVLLERPGRMRVGPLRSIHGVCAILHPTQRVPGLGEIL